MSVLQVPVTDADHLLGNKNAECVLVEYGDYQCPYCRAAHSFLHSLQRHFGEHLLFAFRNFPMVNIHPFAEEAAETAEFAADRGRFWEMHDLIFRYQDRLGIPLFTELTQELGLSSDELKLNLKQQTYKNRIRADFTGGIRSGVNGTPTFYINGTRYNGPNDYDYLLEAITNVLE